MPRTTTKTRPSTKATSSRQLGIEKGFRSGLEEDISSYLQRAGVPFAYEQVRIPYEVHKNCTYTPDFILPNGIIVESKGRFVTADRQKHLMIRDQHPDLEIRFVFTRSASRISKTSKTSYAMWGQKNGCQIHDRIIPRSWME